MPDRNPTSRIPYTTQSLGWILQEPTRENGYTATIYHPPIPFNEGGLYDVQTTQKIPKEYARNWRENRFVLGTTTGSRRGINRTSVLVDHWEPVPDQRISYTGGRTAYLFVDDLTPQQHHLFDPAHEAISQVRQLRIDRVKRALKHPDQTAAAKPTPPTRDNHATKTTRSNRELYPVDQPATDRGAVPPPVPSSVPQKPVKPGEGQVPITDITPAQAATARINPATYNTAWLPVAVPLPYKDREWTLQEGYLRIGYVDLMFAADSTTEGIQISEVMPAESIPTARSRTPLQKDNWHAARQITISLSFANNDAANEVLLPLVRMFRKAPFQPVYNHLLIDAGITAITLQNLQIETLPGFPNALKATLTCQEFNWEAYFPHAGELDGFDSLLCYPLFKLWVEGDWQVPDRPGEPLYQPLPRYWDGQIQMYHPDPQWLESVNEHEPEANRTGRINRTIDAFTRARELRTQKYDPDRPFGFKNSNWRLQLNAPPAGEQVMTDDVGRIDLNGSERLVITVQDAEIARKLLRSGEVQEIVLGPITARRGTLLEFSSLENYFYGTGGRHASRGPWQIHRGVNNAAYTPEEFQRLLEWTEPGRREVGDPNTLINLENGNVRFILPLHARSVDPIAAQKKGKVQMTFLDPQKDRTHGFDPRSMVVEQISVGMENVVAPLQVNGQRTPTHQYLGSQAVYFTITGVFDDATEVRAIDDFMTRVNSMARKYRGTAGGDPFGGFVIVENELFKFFGVRHCLPVSWQVSTVPEFPEALRFELTLVEFDFTQRRREELNDLMIGAQKDPLLRGSSIANSFAARFVRQDYLNDRLRSVDLYPDLKLPTQKQLWEWCQDIIRDRVWDWKNARPYPKYQFLDREVGGTGWQWYARPPEEPVAQEIGIPLPQRFIDHVRNNPPAVLDRFADPDFYCEPSSSFGAQFVDPMMEKIRQGTGIIYRDMRGAEAQTEVRGFLNKDAVKSDPGGSMTIGEEAARSRTVLPLGSSPKLIDDAAWSTEQRAEFEQNYRDAVRGGKGAATRQPEGVLVNPEETTGGAPRTTTIPTSQGAEFVDTPVSQTRRKIAREDQHPSPAAVRLLKVPFKTYPKPQPGSVPTDDSGDKEARIARYGRYVIGAADAYGVPRDLMFAVIDYESGWKQNARSPSSYGLGQINKSAHPHVNVHDAATNINYACQLWAGILKAEPNDWRRAVARYNWGIGNLTRKGIENARQETIDYWINIPKLRTLKYNLGAELPVGTGSRENPTRPEGQTDTSRTGTNKTPDKKERFYSREGESLYRRFREGWGYSPQTIERYTIDFAGPVNPHWTSRNPNPFHDNVVQKTLQEAVLTVKDALGIRREVEMPRSKHAFIKKEWLRPVGIDAGNMTQYSRNAAGTLLVDRSSWYQIQSRFLNDFLEAQRKAGVEIPLEKIPRRLLNEDPTDNDTPDYFPRSIEQAFYNPELGRDMFHDLRREFLSGRLLQAFPTFYVSVIDGGRQLRLWRLYDHIYGIGAITRIGIHRTRKGPVETAVVGFSNMYGHLSSATHDFDRPRRLDTRGVWLLEAIERELHAYNGISEETYGIWAEHLDALMLRAGARLHIRLGCGADASQLPVCFNGTITEVPLSEGEMQVIALSDGIELLNDLEPTGTQGAMPTTRLNSYLGEGLNPREIVMSYLAPNGVGASLRRFIAERTTNLLYPLVRNRYGIEHFGSPLARGLRFDDGEVGINIYNPEHSSPANVSSAWDSAARILQTWKWQGNDKLIGIDMTDARPWDIFETCRKVAPDYVLYPVPVGMRSTLFMGKGWFPLFGEYQPYLPEGALDPLGSTATREAYFEWKPFQQIHLATSAWNLLINDVKTDATNVITKCQAVGTYNGILPGDKDLSSEASFVMELDSDIYDQFQKMKVVKSGLYTTPLMKMGDGLAAEGTPARMMIGSVLGTLALLTRSATLGGAALELLLDGPLRAFLMSRRCLDTYAAMTLRDHVKQMYSGSLVLLGSGYIKPYDLVYIMDELSGLNGMAEVGEVSHTLSAQTGFITTITPECCVSYLDTEWQQALNWATLACNRYCTALITTAVAAKLSRAGSVAAMTRGIRGLDHWLRKSTRQYKSFSIGKLKPVEGIDPTDLKITRDRVKAIRAEFVAAAQIGNNAKLRELLDELGELVETSKVLEKAPFHLKAQIHLQRYIRSAPGTVGSAFEGSIGAGLRSRIGDAARSAADFVDEGLERLKKDAAEADAAVRARGITDAQVETVKKKRAAQGHKALTESEREILELIKGRDLSRSKLAAAMKGTTYARKIGRAATPQILRNTLRQAVSRAGAGVVLSSAISVAMGGLSDYIYRWAIARQCLLLAPLKIYDREFSAGINGHRGAVWGDPIGTLDRFIQMGLDTLRKSEWGGLVPIVDTLVQSEFSYYNDGVAPEDRPDGIEGTPLQAAAEALERLPRLLR